MTSLLEAGSYGLPLVAFCPYEAEAQVLSAGAPGLDGVLLRATCPAEYARTLSRLICDETFRCEVGTMTRERVVEEHCRPGWSEFLDNIYSKATSSSCGPAHKGEEAITKPGLAELDVLLMRLYEGQQSLGAVVDANARLCHGGIG